MNQPLSREIEIEPAHTALLFVDVQNYNFVARLLDGEKMAVLCREFDVSRQSGYKIYARYKDCGLEGLTDRSRRTYRQANRLPFQVESLIVQLRKEAPQLGCSQDPREDQTPAPEHCAARHQHRACGMLRRLTNSI